MNSSEKNLSVGFFYHRYEKNFDSYCQGFSQKIKNCERIGLFDKIRHEAIFSIIKDAFQHGLRNPDSCEDYPNKIIKELSVIEELLLKQEIDRAIDKTIGITNQMADNLNNQITQTKTDTSSEAQYLRRCLPWFDIIQGKFEDFKNPTIEQRIGQQYSNMNLSELSTATLKVFTLCSRKYFKHFKPEMIAANILRIDPRVFNAITDEQLAAIDYLKVPEDLMSNFSDEQSKLLKNYFY